MRRFYCTSKSLRLLFARIVQISILYRFFKTNGELQTHVLFKNELFLCLDIQERNFKREYSSDQLVTSFHVQSSIDVLEE